MWEKLFKSIVTNDSYILWACVITAIVFVVCICFSVIIRRYMGEQPDSRNISFVRFLRFWLRVCYSLFVTMISIFPLLGMFGTVKGLLMMDFVAGNMEYMKHNFFGALTSTAWGIIFSILYKIFYALFHDFIEQRIEDAEKMLKKQRQPRECRVRT